MTSNQVMLVAFAWFPLGRIQKLETAWHFLNCFGWGTSAAGYYVDLCRRFDPFLHSNESFSEQMCSFQWDSGLPGECI